MFLFVFVVLQFEQDRRYADQTADKLINEMKNASPLLIMLSLETEMLSKNKTKAL